MSMLYGGFRRRLNTASRLCGCSARRYTSSRHCSYSTGCCCGWEGVRAMSSTTARQVKSSCGSSWELYTPAVGRSCRMGAEVQGVDCNTVLLGWYRMNAMPQHQRQRRPGLRLVQACQYRISEARQHAEWKDSTGYIPSPVKVAVEN